MARNKYDIDEDLNHEFNAHSIRRMLSYLAVHRSKVAVAVLLMVVASLASLLAPFLLKIAIDESIPAGDVIMLAILGGIVLVAQAINGFFLHLRIRIMNDIGQSVIHTMRADVFSRLQKLGFTYYDSRPHGKILIRVVNYVNSISDLLSNGIINLITDILSLLFIIGFMFVIDVRLTLVCLAALPVLAVVVLSLKKRQRIAWQDMSRKQSNLNAYMHETLSGVRITQSFARESINESIFSRLGGEWRASWLKAVSAFFLVWPGIEIVSVLGVCAVYASGIAWLDEGITVGVLVAFVSYLWRFWTPITTIGNFYASMVQAAAYLERIFETMDEVVPDPLDDSKPVLPPVRGDVSFQDLSFSYDAGRPVLKNISFEVKHGSTVAIVGPTGAGKTTIVNLLSRFYSPDSGAILLDGHNISDFTYASVRARVGVMLQDSFLFSGTVRENIRYGRPNANDGEVEAAARAVHAHEFIMRLDQGYDTAVNERGSRLSMGQRQLISFARVLLADPVILILDEATSSVDTETERAIQKGLSNLLRGRTSFVIAHRLSTIRNAGMILFVDGGRIVEAGTHDELCAASGRYWNLYAYRSNSGDPRESALETMHAGTDNGNGTVQLLNATAAGADSRFMEKR